MKFRHNKKIIFALIALYVLDMPVKAGAVKEETAKQTLIQRVNIFDSISEKLAIGKDVLIVGNVIREIGTDLMPGEGVIIIEGNGRTLMPGLIDMHVHIWDEAELGAYLAHGVTTVRNASGMPFHLQFQTRIESGELVGPRLRTTGPILNGQGPNTQVNHQIVNNAEDARAAVQDQYSRGYRHLKVYSNLSREAYEAILQEADRLGMTVMGHSPEGVRDHGIPHNKPFKITFQEILNHHFVTIEHMETIVWHALYDDLDERKARSLASQIVAAGVTISPTLLSHRNLVEVAKSDGAFLKRPGVETLNPYISSLEQGSYDFWSGQPGDGRRDFDNFYLRAVKIFHEQGVVLVAGTDAGIFTNLPGASLIRELKLYVKAGLTPYEAIKTATVNAARTLELGNKIGRIEAGYLADLILLDGNPLEDIEVLRALSGLMVNGRWYGASEIKDLLTGAANTSYKRTERRVLEGLSIQKLDSD